MEDSNVYPLRHLHLEKTEIPTILLLLLITDNFP